MILQAYSVYDRKTLQYYPPYFAATDGAAARSFSDLANDPNTNVGRHPADYVLYRVGSYNDSKGQLVAEAPLSHVADASQFIMPKPDLFQPADLTQATAANVALLRKGLGQ